MGNIGAGELLVLLLLALLVFGPNKLPEIARNMGKALRSFQQEAQRASNTLRTAIEEDTATKEAPPATPIAPGVIDTPDAPAVGDEVPRPSAALPQPEAPPVDPAMRALEDT